MAQEEKEKRRKRRERERERWRRFREERPGSMCCRMLFPTSGRRGFDELQLELEPAASLPFPGKSLDERAKPPRPGLLWKCSEGRPTEPRTTHTRTYAHARGGKKCGATCREVGGGECTGHSFGPISGHKTHSALHAATTLSERLRA